MLQDEYPVPYQHFLPEQQSTARHVRPKEHHRSWWHHAERVCFDYRILRNECDTKQNGKQWIYGHFLYEEQCSDQEILKQFTQGRTNYTYLRNEA